MRGKCILVTYFWVLGVGTLSAKPIVTYTATGSPGDWTLDFTVTNTTDQLLYHFAVALPYAITGIPSGWEYYFYVDPQGCGCSPYRNSFVTINGAEDDVPIGGSLSGFLLQVNSLAPPATLDWAAATYDGYGGMPYTGTDSTDPMDPDNAQFIGTASITTPEPVTTGSLVAAALLMILWRRPLAWRPGPKGSHT
jgi:hypothetical protein